MNALTGFAHRFPGGPVFPYRIQSRASNIDLIARSVFEASHGIDIAFSPDGFRKGLIHVSLAEPTIFG